MARPIQNVTTILSLGSDTKLSLKLFAKDPCSTVGMRVMLVFVGWCVLFVLCWPLAVLALLLFPFVWLISIPFRLVGVTLEAVFLLLRSVLFLPARLLGARRKDLAPVKSS